MASELLCELERRRVHFELASSQVLIGLKYNASNTSNTRGNRLDYTKLSDVVLMRLIAQQQTEALSALYDRYGRLVFSMAVQVVGDRETAEEITQDVFLRVWENAAVYHSETAKVTTWITSITRYRAIDILRQRRSRPQTDHFTWAEASILPDEVDGPEEATTQALAHHRLRSAINALPPEQRTVLALAYFYGLSHSQIAARLDQPLGTVKTRIRMAMLRLRDLLQDDPSFRDEIHT